MKNFLSNLFVCHPDNNNGVKSAGKKFLGDLGEVAIIYLLITKYYFNFFMK